MTEGKSSPVLLEQARIVSSVYYMALKLEIAGFQNQNSQLMTISLETVCIYGLLTKRDGWILAKFSMDQDGVEVHKITKKNNRLEAKLSDQTMLANKAFITWLLGKYFFRDTVGSPEWAR